MNEVHDAAGDFVCGVFLVYIFAGTIMMLNMLIGFQCEVAARVHAHDTEATEVAYLKQNLWPILEAYDKDGDKHIEKELFEVLLKDPEIHDILTQFGTDVDDLRSLGNILFEDCSDRLSRM